MTTEEKSALAERLETAEKFEKLINNAERALEILHCGMTDTPLVNLGVAGVTVVNGQEYIDICGITPALMTVLERFFEEQIADAKRLLEAL